MGERSIQPFCCTVCVGVCVGVLPLHLSLSAQFCCVLSPFRIFLLSRFLFFFICFFLILLIFYGRLVRPACRNGVAAFDFGFGFGAGQFYGGNATK